MLLMWYIAYVLPASYFRPAYVILAKWREAKIARGCAHERPRVRTRAGTIQTIPAGRKLF